MSDSDDDWFNKDEDELVQNLQQQIQQQVKNEVQEEHIDFCSRADEFRNKFRLDASHEAKSPERFTTTDFAKALRKTPLDMFLYFMSEQRDLLKNQLIENDSLKRVLLYLKVLTILCKLEFGGFDVELLSGFARENVLLAHVNHFAQKLFAPSSKETLDKDSEQMLRSIKFLLLRAHKLGVLEPSGYELIEHFRTLLACCAQPQLLEHPLCIEFAQEMQVLPTAAHVKNEIYPKLEDLLRPETDDAANNAASAVPGDVADYINWHRKLLCEDFAQPLREYVRRLRAKCDIDAVLEQHMLWPHTKLILNPVFADEHQQSIFFVDFGAAVCPVDRRKFVTSKSQRKYLKNIKTGALLCFTTSYEFDNLILATVSHTDPAMLMQGYLCVTIAKQYNIGNICDRPLIMFESPVFFEPYLRVHNYLSTCTADNFPMRRYIVDGQLEIQPPAYIKNGVQLEYNKQPFTAELKLNESQQAAFGAALSTEFCLIQGPPGTGKTHLSVELINVLLQNSARLGWGPIIVLTYTNDSLDKFLLKAAPHTDSILRFGWQSRLPQIEKYNMHRTQELEVPPRLKHVWWMVKCEYKKQFEKLRALHASFDGSQPAYLEIQSALQQLHLVDEKLSTLRTIFQFYQARDKALLAMTTTCAARLNFLFRLLESKCIIFEEAAEIGEAHVLACLTPYTEHVILIGDHKQLQPYTGNYTQQGLQVSLFERLITHKFPASVLNVQYRMRKCIAELLVPIFYDELISASSTEGLNNIKSLTKNMYFVNHQQPEEQMMDMSFINKHEAKELVKLVHILDAKPENIVILTPYNAQVEYITVLLKKKKLEKILVTSVDTYQGLEANIVLLSLVRSNRAGRIGFLRQPNRVCVALSRARWALYIMGNMQTLLQGNPDLWGAINTKLQAADAIGDQFPYCENPKV